jgi:hypothetical protein
MQRLRPPHIEVYLSSSAAASPPIVGLNLSRAQRAHSRLSWTNRFARHEWSQTAAPVTIRLVGLPASFALSLTLATA